MLDKTVFVYKNVVLRLTNKEIFFFIKWLLKSIGKKKEKKLLKAGKKKLVFNV